MSTDPDQAGWALEESLDVEYAHAMAPGANILVVNAPSDDDADFLKTEAALIADSPRRRPVTELR